MPESPTTTSTQELAVGGRPRRLRTVDFTRPTKFSTDQERRLRRAVEAFCPAAMTRMLGEHRTPLELDVVDVEQLTWADAFERIPEASVHVSVATDPHDARLLLSVDLSIVCLAIERLLGGRPDTASTDRELTDIDLMLARRFAGTLVDTLSAIWHDIADVRLDIADVDTQSEVLQLARPGEPTLALTLAARLDGVSGSFTVLVPYAAIAPVAGAFSRKDDREARRDERSAEAVQQRLGEVEVTIRAEVGATLLSLDDVMALKPGDVVRLDADADAEVTVFADATPVHRARGGRNGARRAVQILGTAEGTP